MKSLIIKILLFILIGSKLVFPQQDSIVYINPLQELRSQLDNILDDPNFSNANWGVYVKSIQNGDVIYKRNQDKLFIPASVLKLFTTSTGLLLLGSDYHYKTTIYTNGEIIDNVLHGDLIIRGVGDPTISGRFYDGDITKVFRGWADSLKNIGIDEIKGNIIGDDNLFDEKRLGKGWSWENESYWFSAPISALSFNDNCVDISISPSVINLPAKVDVVPENDYVKVIKKVITSRESNRSNIDANRKRGTNIITVMGEIPINFSEKSIFVTVNKPTQYFLNVLQKVLIDKGIECKGYNIDLENSSELVDYSESYPLFDHYSVRLNKIINETNKNSNNFYAEQLLKTIGLELYEFGSVENGVKEVKNLIKKMGINPENIVFADGSGLSRLSLVTPKQVANLLDYMYKSNAFEDFYNSLPIAGINGSMANRMKNTVAENNLRAKPGYLNGVKTIAGYLKTADGEPLIFVIFVNNFLVPSQLANNVQDNICLKLVNFKRK